LPPARPAITPTQTSRACRTTKGRRTSTVTILKKNLHRDVEGQACLSLTLFLNGRLNRLDLVKDQPIVNRRYEGLYGKDYRGKVVLLYFWQQV